MMTMFPQFNRLRHLPKLFAVVVLSIWSVHLWASNTEPENNPTKVNSQRTVIVNVVTIDQPWMYNRLGAAQPHGMIFALRTDVQAIDGTKALGPGNVRLKDGKRPRPFVIRANEGDIIQINLTNWLQPAPDPYNGSRDSLIAQVYPRTRHVGMHINGMELETQIIDDGTNVGSNPSGLVAPGNSITYEIIAAKEGGYLMYTGADPVGMNNLSAGQISSGLFGSINVQPQMSEYYRSQVTNEDLYLATKYWMSQDGNTKYERANTNDPFNPSNQYTVTTEGQPTSQTLTRSELATLALPIINYQATYPNISARNLPSNATDNLRNAYRHSNTNPAGNPILCMVKSLGSNQFQLMHSDLTAIITGPNASHWPDMLNEPVFYAVGEDDPTRNQSAISPDRRAPYREFAIHYHEAPMAVQAFPQYYSTDLGGTLQAGKDLFAINYGTGGIGSEIVSNRLEIGPSANCVDCVYEEFFLSSWPLGDPAMPVDIPANANNAVVSSTGNEAEKRQLWLDEVDDLTDYMTGIEKGVDSNKFPDGVYPAFKRNADGSRDFSEFKYKATKSLYPDDPSNVYHSYMNDHVKFRINHAGGGVTHVHHQHAHQWLHSPNSSNGHYLDSQTINPGTTHTLEIVYHGSGNRNKTVGDQIFHCHFYPHFASGMWSMWRVHDVMEAGTELNPNGVSASGSRAYPDGEIQAGTPIVGLVPMPTYPMAPAPAEVHIENGQVIVTDSTKNVGYPFFIPGVAGSRAPHPPMDFAIDGTETLDGGLPRNVLVNGDVVWNQFTPLDWSKYFDNLTAVKLPEEGTRLEKVAMATHAQSVNPSILPNDNRGIIQKGNFTLNGLPPRQGAPYADPVVLHYDGNHLPVVPNATGVTYKAAVIEMDVLLNKEGWHYPQQRFIALWDDVKPLVAGTKVPEPFFFRANSYENYINFWHTNLLPAYYELDAFQVRTPTDIIGQHIHLVKFDVTSSDGAANGWNYEDGTFSPEEVQERIKVINKNGSLFNYVFKPGQPLNNTANYTKINTPLTIKPANPVWGDPPPGQNWDGAQTTVQLWYADPLVDNSGFDRTIRTVFTHDHFSPSTHQQAGLYAGLLVEPFQSKWLDAQTGEPLGTRSDGGPTSWQAIIQNDAHPDSTYREFALEFQDISLAYFGYFDNNQLTQDQLTSNPSLKFEYPEFPDDYWADPSKFANDVARYNGYNVPGKFTMGNYLNAINPPLVLAGAGNSSVTQPNRVTTPQLVTSGGGIGTFSVNYRSEPLYPRVSDFNLEGQFGGKTPTRGLRDQTVGSKGIQTSSGEAGDFAHVFRSIERPNAPWLNSQPTENPWLNSLNKTNNQFDPKYFAGQQGTDPFTPLLRAYEGDRIQVRTLVGAHQNPHSFNIQGNPWLFEPGWENSGFRSTQIMGISEHFEMNFFLPSTQGNTSNGFTDYLYFTSADQPGLQEGSWGLMRSYDISTSQDLLAPLSNNPIGNSSAAKRSNGCPDPLRGRPVKTRDYDITAILASDLYPEKAIVYNERAGLYDPFAMVFVRTEDLPRYKNGELKSEPLILRAAAGECIQVTLRNAIDVSNPSFYDPQIVSVGTQGTAQTFSTTSASGSVGLHAELVSTDTYNSNGINAGFNQVSSAPPADKATVQAFIAALGNATQIDNLKGTLPTVNYNWYAGRWERTNATGMPWKNTPVEFGSCVLSSADLQDQYARGLMGALIIEPVGATWQEDQGTYASATVTKPGPTGESFREFVLIFQDLLSNKVSTQGAASGGTGGVGLNYRSAPIPSRYQNFSGFSLNRTDLSNMFTDQIVGGPPETPSFIAEAGDPVRYRLIHPGGDNNGSQFSIDGHVWQELPYINGSTVIGDNDTSQYIGMRGQIAAMNSFDVVLPSAGGQEGVEGQYWYHSYSNVTLRGGQWGLMTVTGGEDDIQLNQVNLDFKNNTLYLQGNVSVAPGKGDFAAHIFTQYQNSSGGIWRSIPAPDKSRWCFNTTKCPNGEFELLISNIDGLGLTANNDDFAIKITSSNGGTVTFTNEKLLAFQKAAEQFKSKSTETVSELKDIKIDPKKTIRPTSEPGQSSGVRIRTRAAMGKGK